MNKSLIGLSTLSVFLIIGCGTPEVAEKRSIGDGESLKQLKKSCNLNDGFVCSRLGFLYMNGEDVKQNYSKAKKYYGKACALNDKSGCYMLGVFYEYGSGGLEQNYSKAKKYYSKACDLNVSMGCSQFAALGDRDMVSPRGLEPRARP